MEVYGEINYGTLTPYTWYQGSDGSNAPGSSLNHNQSTYTSKINGWVYKGGFVTNTEVARFSTGFKNINGNFDYLYESYLSDPFIDKEVVATTEPSATYIMVGAPASILISGGGSTPVTTTVRGDPQTQTIFQTLWVDLGPAPRETYSLNFVFTQQPSSSGQIQAGRLTAVITGSYGDTRTFSTQATTDDALPLKSGDAPIKARISDNFTGNDLVFNLKGLSANPNQKNVELHGGHITDYGQISGDSQSCVIAQIGFMPNLLTTLTQDYQNSLGYAASSSDDVANWINSSCSPTMTSANALSQALLSVQNAPKQGGLLFSLSRTLEKVVKVLFDVTDERTGDTTVREAFIQPNTQSTVISFASLFNNGKNAGLGDHYLTNPNKLSSYESHYNVKLPGADKSDRFDVSIDAYQILYQGGRTDGRPADYNPWYFDTKNGVNNSGTDVSGEYLMFGSRKTTSFTM